MAFGQPLGPPASAPQLRELLALLQEQGYAGFRDARGPLGFTQRQGTGKFTRDEAAAFIEQLQAEESGDGAPTEAGIPTRTDARVSAREQLLRQMPAEQLAAELQRRGWAVLEP